jgi:5'-methylthioinosine phosphorylase
MSTVAIIGGSGAGLFPAHGNSNGNSKADVETIEQQTKWGNPSAPLRSWQQHGHTVLFLARHGDEASIAPHEINYRANMQALADLGADHVIATNAVGGIAAAAAPGALVVPEQLVDYTWGRRHTIFEGESAVKFIEFTEPYDAALRANLIRAADFAGIAVVAQGVYGVTQGPRLETAAEIDRLERDGCTIVGMTAMPEAALARELELSYVSCCNVVNFAAGRSAVSIHAEMHAHLEQGMAQTAALVDQLLKQL